MRAKLLTTALIAPLLAGCQMMASELIDDAAPRVAEGRPACSSTAGSYHLSKSYFRVRVDLGVWKGEDNTEPAVPVHVMRYLAQNIRPDRNMGYCLDYLASPTAHDTVRVYKTQALPDTACTADQIKYKARDCRQAVAAIPGLELKNADLLNDFAQVHKSGSDLLQLITTDAIDESAFILKGLIRAMFVGVSGLTSFGDGFAAPRSLPTGKASLGRKLDLEYDPFDVAQSAMINDALKDLGFCIIVKGVTFEGLHDGTTVNSYCDNPRHAVAKSQRLAQVLHEAEEAKVARHVRGVLYRPRLPYTVMIFLKKNKQLPGGWVLRGTEIAEMENISPVLALGIERAFFAQRKTVVYFQEGVVKDVCIFKSSELAPLSEIPLEIARSIVALPAAVVQVKINTADSDQRLAAAQKSLVDTQVRHLKAMQAIEAKTIKEISDELDAKNPKPQAKPPGSETAEAAKAKSQYELLGKTFEDVIAAAADDAKDSAFIKSVRRVRLETEGVCRTIFAQHPLPTAFGQTPAAEAPPAAAKPIFSPAIP